MYKVFLVVSAYATALYLYSLVGHVWGWRGAALIVGTTASGLIVAAHSKNIYTVMEIGFFMLLGLVVALAITPYLAHAIASLQSNSDTIMISSDLEGQCGLVATVLGLVGGGLAASWLQSLRKPPSERPAKL
jgi:hypothetical protein